MAFDRLEHGFLRQAFYEFEFVFVLRDGFIGLERLVRIHAHGGHLFAEYLLADGFDHLVAVHVHAQVALDRALRLGFGRRQDAGHHVGILGDRVQVRRRAAHVEHDAVADAVVQQLRAFHDRAGGRDDGTVHHVAHVLHARRAGDVILEGILDDLAAGFDVQFVDLGIDVFDIVKRHAALFVEDELHFLLVFDVACVDHGHLQPHGAQHFRVVDGGVAFAVVHAARQQDQVRLDLLDLRQVASAQPSCGHVVDDAARTERRFLRGFRGHVVNQAVDGHLQTAGSGGRGQHLVVFERIDVGLLLQVFDRAGQADAHVALQDGRGRLTLREEHGMVGIQILERVYDCCGGADLGY